MVSWQSIQCLKIFFEKAWKLLALWKIYAFGTNKKSSFQIFYRHTTIYWAVATQSLQLNCYNCLAFKLQKSWNRAQLKDYHYARWTFWRHHIACKADVSDHTRKKSLLIATISLQPIKKLFWNFNFTSQFQELVEVCIFKQFFHTRCF